MKYNIHILGVRKATWTKYNKYRVELQVYGEKDRVFWLSQKQMDKLNSELAADPSSRKGNRLIGVLDDGRYCYCYRAKEKREFIRPRDYDLSDLVEEEDED